MSDPHEIGTTSPELGAQSTPLPSVSRVDGILAWWCAAIGVGVARPFDEGGDIVIPAYTVEGDDPLEEGERIVIEYVTEKRGLRRAIACRRVCR